MRRVAAVLICLLSTSIAAFGQDTMSPKEEADAVTVSKDILGHDMPYHGDSHHHLINKYDVAITVHVCCIRLANEISESNTTFLMNGLADSECRKKALSLANMR